MFDRLPSNASAQQQFDHIGNRRATHLLFARWTGETISARCHCGAKNDDSLDSELHVSAAWAPRSNFCHLLFDLSSCFAPRVPSRNVRNSSVCPVNFCSHWLNDVPSGLDGDSGAPPVGLLDRWEERRLRRCKPNGRCRPMRSIRCKIVNPLLPSPIAFAHRGARAHAAENTLDAFRLAVRLGATGMESDVWLTADGIPVLDHDGVVRTTLRKRLIKDLDRCELPAHIPSLNDLYDAVGTSYPLSLDIKDPDAGEAVIEVARRRDAQSSSGAPNQAITNLWLCSPNWRDLVPLRAKNEHVRLVDSTRLRRIDEGPERRAAQLAAAKIDAVNMHYSDWTGGLVALFHRFEVFAFGWDAQHPRMVRALLGMGIDGVYADDVEMMMENVTRRAAEH